MPIVVGASTSAKVCSFGERWGPCAPHPLDKNMERAFLSGQDDESITKIREDMTAAKE